MKPTGLIVALLLTATPLAFAAPLAYTMLDHSATPLMDESTAKAVWQAKLPARLPRLYTEKRWGFVSEVEGGFDESKTCIVTARAMMLPRSGKALLFRPVKTATAFGAQANANTDQCKALARSKFEEAVTALGGALIANP